MQTTKACTEARNDKSLHAVTMNLNTVERDFLVFNIYKEWISQYCFLCSSQAEPLRWKS